MCIRRVQFPAAVLTFSIKMCVCVCVCVLVFNVFLKLNVRAGCVLLLCVAGCFRHVYVFNVFLKQYVCVFLCDGRLAG